MGIKLINNNKKAYHEYFIEDTYEAGICLEGSEVKSVRDGGISLVDSFVFIKDNEVFLKNCYIKQYEKSSSFCPDSRRSRKLLLNRQEISKIEKKVKEKGYSVIPTKVYLKDNLVKIEIAIAKGKHLYDKRDVEREKSVNKEILRVLKKY